MGHMYPNLTGAPCRHLEVLIVLVGPLADEITFGALDRDQKCFCVISPQHQ